MGDPQDRHIQWSTGAGSPGGGFRGCGGEKSGEWGWDGEKAGKGRQPICWGKMVVGDGVKGDGVEDGR